MKLNPQGNRLIAEVLPLVPDSQIIIPDAAKSEDGGKFVVIEVGPGKILADGTVVPIPVKVGDEIIVDPRQGYINALSPEWLYGNRRLCVIEYESVIVHVERSAEEVEKLKEDMMKPQIAKPAFGSVLKGMNKN